MAYTTVLILLFTFGHLQLLTAGADAPLISPKFTTEPSDTIAKPGSSVLLRCRAKGTPTPTYRWLRNEKELTLTGTGRVRLRPSGDLYFEKVDPVQDDATYRCVAEITKFSYKIISKKAELKVVAFPKSFKNSPKATTGYEGGAVRLWASLEDYEPHPLIAWRYKGKATIMNNDKRFTVLPQGVLQITNLQNSEGGQVQAIARDPLGSSIITSSFATVDVQPGRPKGDGLKFLGKPQNLTLRWGKSAIMECFGDSPNKVSYSWFKDGKLITMNNRFSLVGEGNFKISYVREEDDGTYKCQIEDGKSRKEASATLQVQIPPLFTMVPGPQYGQTDGSITFRYQVRGIPKPTIRWYKDGIKLGAEADYIELGDGYFTLNGIIKSDRGMYQVFALNPLGEAQAEAALQVLERGQTVPTTQPTPKTDPVTDSLRPGKPENVKAVTVSGTEILVSWEPPKVTNGNIIRYVVVYFTSPGSAKPQIVDGSKTSVKIANLTPNTKYSFKVRAVNQAKPGALSQLVTATTQAATAPNEVGSLSSGKSTADSVFFSWNTPTSGPAVSKYVIYYMNMDDAKSKTFQQTTTTTSVTITGLKPSSTYKFWVIPYSGKVMGTRSKEITIKTEKEPPKIPNAARDLIVTLGSSKVITLSWNAPLSGPKPTRYRVYYQDIDRGLKPAFIGTSALTAFVQNLKGNTQYKVWVVPYSGSYPGPKSREVTVKTPIGVPTVQPQDFKIADVGPTSIRLSWKGLTDDQSGGELRGYRLKYRATGRKDTSKSVILGKSSTEVLLSNLAKDTEYIIKLSGFSLAGNGPHSTLAVKTSGSDPLITAPVPRDFKVAIDPERPDTAVLSWQPPDTYTGRIQKYYIYYRKESSFDWSEMVVDGNKVTTNISGLEPATIYYFKIRGVDNNGQGSITLPIQFKSMSESTVPGSVTDMNIKPYPTYLIINWNPPSGSSIVTRGYSVKVTDADTDKVLSSFQLNGRKKTSLNVLKDIGPGRKYYVTVAAFNRAGSGKITKMVTSTPTVTNSVVKVFDARSGVKDASFRWTDDNPSTSAYYIKFFTYDAKGMPLERIITVDQREVAITGLNAFTEYKFYIRRQTDQDFPLQPSIIIKTKAAVPSKPLDVTAAKDKNFPSWIVLNWQVPEYPNGHIKQYIIRYTTNKDADIKKWKRIDTGKNVMTFNVTGLTEGTVYYFKVFAENQAGVGAGSATLDTSTGGVDVPGGVLPPQAGPSSEDNLNGKLWWIILLILLLLFLLLLLLLLLYCCFCRKKGEKCCPCCAKFMDNYCWPCLRTCCPCCCSTAGAGAGGGKKKSFNKNTYVAAPNGANGYGNHAEIKRKNGKGQDLWVSTGGTNEALELSNIKPNGTVQAGSINGGGAVIAGSGGGVGLGTGGGAAGAIGAGGLAGAATGAAAGAGVLAAGGAAGSAAGGGGAGGSAGIAKAGVKVALPGDATFISYKTSLQDYCQKVGWLPPYYSTQQGGTGFFSTVSFGGNQSYSSGAISAGSKQEAEQKAGLAALKGIGLLPVDTTHGVEANIAVPSPGEPSFISYKCSLHDFCQQCNILPPRFVTSRQGSGFTSQVQVGSHTFNTEQLTSSSQDSEQFAAFTGLQGLCMIESGSKYVPNACFTVPGPGDQKFVSFKSSLHDFCQRYKLPPPQYITTQQPQGYSAKLKFGGLFFQSSDYFPTRLEAEQHAAFEALQGLGLLESAVRFGSADGSRVNTHGSTPSLSSAMVASSMSHNRVGSYSKAGSTSQLNYVTGHDIDIPSYRSTLNRQNSRDQSTRADLSTGMSSTVTSSSQDSYNSKSYSTTLDKSYRIPQSSDISTSNSYSRQYSNNATYDVPAKSVEHSYTQKSYLIGGSPSLSSRDGGTSSYTFGSSSGRTTPTLSNTRVFIATESNSNKPKAYQGMSETRNQYGKDAIGVSSNSGYSTTGGYSVSYQQSSVKSSSSTLPRRTSPYVTDGQYQYSAKASTLGGNSRSYSSSTAASANMTDGMPRSASHPALSELEREMQGLEGLIRDLNGITASEQELYA